ncbi:MAG TPA: hypothetical protein VKE40_08355 [Gemmataceae bacterium]|nr:hypothetical protein [Gemmataceae bacterium]
MDEQLIVTVYDANGPVDVNVPTAVHTDQSSWGGQFMQSVSVAFGKRYLIQAMDGRRGEIVVGSPAGSGRSFQGVGAFG